MYSEQIKRIRVYFGLSVAKLSKMINIPERTIVSYESGRNPSIEFLAQLCKVLNINPMWFLFGKEYEMFITPQLDASKDVLRQQVLDILKDEGLIK